MMKILIIKLGAIGDVIRTTSVLQGLKSEYRDCKIDWVTKEECLDVLKNNNLIDNVCLIDSKINRLKYKKYTLVINLDDDYVACELASKIKPKKIVGAFLRNKHLAYTNDSALWFDLGLLSRFGKKKADELKAKNKKTYQEIMYKILGLEYRKQKPILILNKKELNFGKKFAQKNNIKKTDLVIGINTGAGGRWEDKKLSIEKTAELIDKLNDKIKSDRNGVSGELKTDKSKAFVVQKITKEFSRNKKFLSNAKILLFGGPEEVERNKKIKNLVKTRIIDAGCKNSLMEFASLVNLCNLLVTSDSLALHIGVALNKKIVAFFYPTSSSEIELYRRGIKIIGKGKSYCSYETKCKYPPTWNIENIINAINMLIKK